MTDSEPSKEPETENDGPDLGSMSEPPFERPPVVRLEDESNVPEETVLAQLNDIDILEFAYYFEPEFDQDNTFFHLDPYTDHKPEENLFYFALRLALLEGNNTDSQTINQSADQESTELGTVTVRLSFRILNMYLLYNEESDQMKMPGPVLANILNTTYNVVQGVWVAKVEGTQYRQFHLPTPDLNSLMEDFFGYSADATPEVEDDD